MTLKEKLAAAEAKAQMFKTALEKFIEQRKDQLDNPECYATGYYLYEEKVPRKVEVHLLEVWYNGHKHLLQ